MAVGRLKFFLGHVVVEVEGGEFREMGVAKHYATDVLDDSRG